MGLEAVGMRLKASVMAGAEPARGGVLHEAAGRSVSSAGKPAPQGAGVSENQMVRIAWAS